MSAASATKVPPNGEWGWMIVLAYALNGLSTVSIIQGFGLIFKDTFRMFGFSATQGTIIINTNLAFGMILGLFNGPLLRYFGYRKMAILGSLLYSVGVTITAFARSFTTIIIFYGLFASLGTVITLSAFSYALNSYFTTKRGRAMSLAMTIIGLGPILIPQLTTFLISYYGFQGTILIYGAFSLHSIVGGILLHPLKWHTKDANNPKPTTEDLVKNEKENEIADQKSGNFSSDLTHAISMPDISITHCRQRTTTITSVDHDAEIGSIYGIDIPYARQISETLNASLGGKELDTYKIMENGQAGTQPSKNQLPRGLFKSVDTINLGSCISIFEEKSTKPYTLMHEYENDHYDLQNSMEERSLLQKGAKNITINAKSDKNNESTDKWTMLWIFKAIAELFDLKLLRDPIYVNLMVGMSVAIFAEINFSQLTPFILMDMKLSTEQIATVMSMIASVDLVFRTLAPFMGEWLRQPPRIMYMFSLCLLIISRTCLVFVNGFISMIAVAIGLGAAKGIRSVYMSLVIPSHVPINRLPYASGIQMIVNGTILLFAGPVLGVMRDNIGSYTPCIIMINSVTALTVIMWLTEMFIVRRKKVQKEMEQRGNS